MSLTHIDGKLLKNMIIAGANALNQNRDIIDALNVFPVPDGDTGTNMSMTILAAAKEVDSIVSNDVREVAVAASNGSLRGARGNSGVILSQLFRGFSKGLEGNDTATVDDLAAAFAKAAETAYKAVMKPKEGTMLTVAKIIAEHAEQAVLDTDDISSFLGEIIIAGNEILKKTTEMLPALKQANVVDAGGQGIMCVLEGAFAVLSGNTAEIVVTAKLPDKDKISYGALASIEDADIEFTYCTEFFINHKFGQTDANERFVDEMKVYLDTIGDSIVVVSDEKIIKIHVHSNDPGHVLAKAMTAGELSSIKIENMREQHTEKIGFANNDAGLPPKPPSKKFGFVAVAMGEGFKEIFESLGADVVIEGGQTMNPSSEDILKAIEKVDAENIFVLPNNKNIILTANQAATMTEAKNAVVIPTKSIPQGVTALMSYSDMLALDENTDAMNDQIETVHCGQVTYAVRKSEFNGKEINEGDILCLYDGDIALVSDDVEKGTSELIDYMVKQAGCEIMTIYYGEPSNNDDADKLAQLAAEKHPDCEIEVQDGGQPLYYYIISTE